MLALSNLASIVLQSSEAPPMGVLVVAGILSLVLFAAMWKIYTKAGQPGWAAIIPIYNLYILLKIVGRPGWWLLLMLVPIVNFIVIIIVYIDLAKSFGKGTLFGIALIFLSYIMLPVLGFGSAQYVGPAGAK